MASLLETEAPPVQRIETALDGAEFVIRGELASGDTERGPRQGRGPTRTAG